MLPALSIKCPHCPDEADELRFRAISSQQIITIYAFFSFNF